VTGNQRRIRIVRSHSGKILESGHLKSIAGSRQLKIIVTDFEVLVSSIAKSPGFCNNFRLSVGIFETAVCLKMYTANPQFQLIFQVQVPGIFLGDFFAVALYDL
jgi:hypothetical protein